MSSAPRSLVHVSLATLAVVLGGQALTAITPRLAHAQQRPAEPTPPAGASPEALAALDVALEARDRAAAREHLARLAVEGPAALVDVAIQRGVALQALGLEPSLLEHLGRVDDAKALERLLDVAGNRLVGRVAEHAGAVAALAAVKHPELAKRAGDVAVAAVDSGEPLVAAAAARALAALGGTNSVGKLVQRLERAEAASAEAAVATAAQQALAKLTGEPHEGAAAWRRYLDLRDAAAKPKEHPIAAMIILGLIMLATYGVIAFELAPKSLAALTGAGASVIIGLSMGLFHGAPGETAYKYVHHVIEHDLGVLGVIIGTSVLVEVAGRSGLFHFVAVKIVKQTKGDPQKLFLMTGLMTMLFVTFLTIAPGSLIAISLILVVTKALNYDAKPYLVFIAIAANSGALMTFASGVCTLMLATAGKLGYTDFFFISSPMGLISGALAYFVLRWAYRDSLVATGDPAERAKTIEGFDEWAVVKDKKVFYRIGGVLLCTILGFAVAQKIGIGLDFVAFMGATAGLILSGENADEAIKKVNWGLIIFFVGLFVIIGAVQASGLLDLLGQGLMDVSGGSQLKTLLVLGVFVLLMSGVVDNIPVAATMIPIVHALAAQGADPGPIWWTLIMTSNLGGNSTPVGSVSTILALSALEKERGVKVSWGEFLKVGGMIFGLQATVVIAYIIVFHSFSLFPGS